MKFTTGKILDFLVDEIVKLERFDDVSLELRRQEGGLDLLEEQLPDGALKLGRDGLRLHANLHFRNLLGSIRFERTSQKTAEGGLRKLAIDTA